MADLPTELFADRIVAVLRAPEMRGTRSIVEALVECGIRCVEFTWTIADVLSHVETAIQVDGAVVGVGTVLHAQQVIDAEKAGARFIVTPSVRPAVAQAARDRNIPFVLGAWTPSEVAHAIDLEASAVKIFPAEIGGPALLKALRGPFDRTDFIPSGGVTTENAGEWLMAGARAISVGSLIIPRISLEQGNVTEIETRARDLVTVVRAHDRG
jgi:2-dehydro-3-deoxyphosphogluconate aldolase/(4S)-4-hydroxy-2-oxoglutarate aldolase